MSKLWFMGDTHGSMLGILRWASLVEAGSTLIHVGDFNAGMLQMESLERLNDWLEHEGSSLAVVRGNHDDPGWFRGSSDFPNIKFLPDNSIVESDGLRVLCVGGATSVDRSRLIEGVTWWAGEGFGWDGKVPDPVESPIDIVVTHSAGSWMPVNDNSEFMRGWYADDALVTGRDLRAEVEEERLRHDELLHELENAGHQLRAWFHGHFHRRNLNSSHRPGTHFVCLHEATRALGAQTVNADLEELPIFLGTVRVD